jgi:hypothetical protein
VSFQEAASEANDSFAVAAKNRKCPHRVMNAADLCAVHTARKRRQLSATSAAINNADSSRCQCFSFKAINRSLSLVARLAMVWWSDKSLA